MLGLVHIYTGNGKGKTTAAIGLGVRACGNGFRVLMVQFLKSTPTGELQALKRLEPGFQLVRGTETGKFTWEMNEIELGKARAEQERLLEHASKAAAEGRYDVIILDEVMAAINTKMIKKEQVIQLVMNKPSNTELVLTGRDAPAELIELADYVSEIMAFKHPMEKGVPPRKGIEC